MSGKTRASGKGRRNILYKVWEGISRERGIPRRDEYIFPPLREYPYADLRNIRTRETGIPRPGGGTPGGWLPGVDLGAEGDGGREQGLVEAPLGIGDPTGRVVQAV